MVNDTRSYDNILIIDDAIGSGATINETAKKIREKKMINEFVYGCITNCCDDGWNLLQNFSSWNGLHDEYINDALDEYDSGRKLIFHIENFKMYEEILKKRLSEEDFLRLKNSISITAGEKNDNNTRNAE